MLCAQNFVTLPTVRNCNDTKMNLAFPIEINILDFIFKGIVIGVLASAPMGPVGILCIQRTLNKGRWYGFVTGVACMQRHCICSVYRLGHEFCDGFCEQLREQVLSSDFRQSDAPRIRNLLLQERSDEEHAQVEQQAGTA